MNFADSARKVLYALAGIASNDQYSDELREDALNAIEEGNEKLRKHRKLFGRKKSEKDDDES